MIVVSDLNAAAALYGQTFGLKSGPPQLAPDLQATRLRFDTGNAYVDVVQPASEASPLGQFLKDRGEGIYLIAVQVDDLEGTLTTLRQRGAEIHVEAGRTFISPKTTHGALMELIE
ncbi:MAG: methylmalonyl-CoA epimerase [Dehalococcoidia bacterium]|nr:methylmalonyl-CoA epimerase [Dehalococcoidia bacterium]